MSASQAEGAARGASRRADRGDRRRAPGQERQRRRGGGQDADDADIRERQVQPVDVDDRVERERGDQAAAVEPLGERDPRQDRPIAQRAERIAGREAGGRSASRRAKADVGDRADHADEARDRDSGRAAEPVGEDAAGEARRARPAAARPDPEEADDPTEEAGRIHRAPQAQVERAAEREAEPEDDATPRSSRRPIGHDGEQRAAMPAPAPRMSASWRGDRGPNRPANAPSRFAMNGAAARAARPIGSRPPRRAIVGRSVVTSATRHPDADGRDQVEREIAPDRALGRRRAKRWPEHRRTSKQPAWPAR